MFAGNAVSLSESDDATANASALHASMYLCHTLTEVLPIRALYAFGLFEGEHGYIWAVRVAFLRYNCASSRLLGRHSSEAEDVRSAFT